jgi:Na+/proline symporter
VIGAITLSGWDWAFLVWFLAVTTGVGLYYAKRAGRNLQEYFLSGRNLPWWALGTSIVATTFAADTPIVVAGFVISGGIAQNWLWWSFLFGGTLTVFLFSKLWRRAAVVTEIELIALRYDGGAARALRGFKAVFLGLCLNSIIFGFVTKAMLSIVEVVFPGLDPAVSLGALLGLTLVYTALSGLWGVVATDVLQFVMAVLGAVLLAALGVAEVGGLGALVDAVREAATAGGKPHLLSIVPTGWDAFTAGVFILVLVNWWAVYYPGAEPGGGGYVVQRMSAAIDERHARLGNLWFVFAHYVLRPWPWILVALCAVALEPRFLDAARVIADAPPGATGSEVDALLAADGLTGLKPEQAYPWMFRLLPVGLLGLVAASFLAAFMSTITTTLNLSASYLVNDLYLPFLAKGAEDERRQVAVARFAVGLVMVLGALVSWVLVSAGDGWTKIMDLTAGSGLVLILRWLWWRVNAWSEIAAMVGSAVGYVAVRGYGLDEVLAAATGAPRHEIGMLAIVLVSTLCWLTVTAATRPVAAAQLDAFYRRVRPGGAWAPVAAAAGIAPHAMGRDLRMWIASTILVFGALFGLGSLLLLDSVTGAVCAAAAVLAGCWLRALFVAEARAEREGAA